MARLQDSRGRLLGGLNTITRDTANPSPQSRMGTRLAPQYGPEETVPHLVCSYGSQAHRYTATPLDAQNAQVQSRKRGCHSSVETPDERHHCDQCGGDFCAVHAEPAQHDCDLVIQPS